MSNKTNDSRSVVMFVSSMLIFGTVGVLRRYIPLPSALLAFTRGILGGLFLLVFVRIRKKGTGNADDPGVGSNAGWSAVAEGPVAEGPGAEGPSAKNPGPGIGAQLPPGVLPRLIITGIMIGINWILLFEAYNYTTVAVATLCYYMQPTIVMLLSPVIFKERLTGRKMACAAISVIGMVLVSGVIGNSGVQSGNIQGVLMGLGAALLYAAVVIMNKMIPAIDAYHRTTVLLLSAGIVMLPYLLLTDGFSSEGAGAVSVILLLILGIVHTGIAYTLYFGSMDGLRVQSIAVMSYIDPVSALLFSALLLREPLSLPNIVGAVMIIGSAMVSEIQPAGES